MRGFETGASTALALELRISRDYDLSFCYTRTGVSALPFYCIPSFSSPHSWLASSFGGWPLVEPVDCCIGVARSFLFLCWFGRM